MKRSSRIVEEHGRLRVQGNKIVDKDGIEVSLAGMSYFWSNEDWDGKDFYTEGSVDELVNEWGCQVVRCAMGVEAEGGYISNPTENKETISTVINRAIDLGIYVIVDFHSHEAENYQTEAIEFFKWVIDEFGNADNLIFEIYNEPLDTTTWQTIKNYANPVIDEIRDYNDNKNLIIVGTREWCQRVEEAAADPLQDSEGRNIAYTLHFYAATHGRYLMDRAKQAKQDGIALFVTEWGTTNNLGQCSPNVCCTHQWTQFMAEQNLSHCNWSVCDKIEGCHCSPYEVQEKEHIIGASALKKGANPNGGWTSDNLSPSGKMAKEIISNWDVTVDKHHMQKAESV
jgi:aryl-phospho-beta-D-glucosidase BglC (GH1 family)